MAKYKTKGVVLKKDIASTLTPVSQLISLSPPNKKSTSFAAATIDQADADPAKGREMSGWAESDGFDAEIFWDPILAVHAALNDDIDTPVKSTFEIEFLGDGLASASSKMNFDCAGMTLGPTTPFEDGLKASISGELDGIPTVTAGSEI